MKIFASRRMPFLKPEDLRERAAADRHALRRARHEARLTILPARHFFARRGRAFASAGASAPRNNGRLRHAASASFKHQ